MAKPVFVIGVDFGTDSVRSVLVNAHNGQEMEFAVFYYPRWRDGLFCDPQHSRFRQHPRDYIEGLQHTITTCLQKAGPAAGQLVAAISIATTGSTPVAVDAAGRPLAFIPGFESNPNAMFVLWKDHTATAEAAEINSHAAKFDVNYLRFVGGIYSSEWFWAKLLHVLRTDQQVADACYSWVEHCDWIPFLLTGGAGVQHMKRSVCAAGHKALWAPEFGGLPPDTFFSSLDPLLSGFTQRLFRQTHTADQPAGTLSPEWAARLGLSTAVQVGVGAFDAHMGAVGAQIEPYHLAKIMGTSTCDMLVAPAADLQARCVRGICGQVTGSVIPGMVGLEAGQSAFGDTFAWFKDLLIWPLEDLGSAADSETVEKIRRQLEDGMIANLSACAAQLPPLPDGVLALDWLNGRRTPDADQNLKGAIFGLSLGATAPHVFAALAEATCFGARAIVDRFTGEGVPIRGLIGLGGVAHKSPYVMQLMADVMQRPIRIPRSEQTCALGAAMFAATVAGIYPKVEDAMAQMGSGVAKQFDPNPMNAAIYDARYQKYQAAARFVENHLTERSHESLHERVPRA
jgi:L-ribulokinase